MRIDVNLTHITRGVRGEPEHCAIALAMQEATGEAWQVGCDCMWRPGVEGTYPLSEVVEQWVADFDDGKIVRPMSFEF